MTPIYYAAQINNKDLLAESSSGGIFGALAEIILERYGVVFGAAWADNFNSVNIIEINNKKDLNKILKSKYVCSSVNKTFSRIKELLEKNVLVLFSGLPCQVYALKTFLKDNYSNLICIEICCHGILPLNIWQDYLKSIQKVNASIIDINMRDKRLGWNDFGVSIKYSDGSELFETKKTNKYMRAFLSDKYLNNSCYNCKFKNEFSKADLTLGDLWNFKEANLAGLDIKSGISLVIVHTEVGLNLFNKITNCIKHETSKEIAEKHNGGMHNRIEKPKETYNKNIFNKNNKLAIITLNFNNNIGGVLQGYALYTFLTKHYYDVTIVQNRAYKDNLEFVKKLKIKFVKEFSEVKNSYNTFIVGSDQIWRRRFLKSNIRKWEDAFLDFCKNEKVHRLGYAISCGTNEFDFKDVLLKASFLMKKFDYLSLREDDLIPTISKLSQKDVKLVCDPTLLLDKTDYEELCKEVLPKEGLFTYLLDKTPEKLADVNNCLHTLGVNQLEIPDNNLEAWLAAYRDCSCVITDSYHGCLFSIIFNKPFICFYNKKRGNSRFETLIKLFDLRNRFIEQGDPININLLKEKPNINRKEIVKYSEDFLLGGLEKING